MTRQKRRYSTANQFDEEEASSRLQTDLARRRQERRRQEEARLPTMFNIGNYVVIHQERFDMGMENIGAMMTDLQALQSVRDDYNTLATRYNQLHASYLHHRTQSEARHQIASQLGSYCSAYMLENRRLRARNHEITSMFNQLLTQVRNAGHSVEIRTIPVQQQVRSQASPVVPVASAASPLPPTTTSADNPDAPNRANLSPVSFPSL